jgi:hypothetical protein
MEACAMMKPTLLSTSGCASFLTAFAVPALAYGGQNLAPQAKIDIA